MSRFRRLEIIEPIPSFLKETCIFTPKPLNPCFPSFPFEEDDLNFTLDLLNPNPILFQDDLLLTSPFHDFADLIQINKTPSYTSTQRVQKQVGTEFYLQSLSDRVSALELGFDRLLPKPKPSKLDRKYSWTAEIKSPEEDGLDRKYKLITEIKGGKEEKTYKWTTEIKGKGKDSPISRTYTFKASAGNAGDSSGSQKKEKNGVVAKKNKKSCEKTVGPARVVEIEEPTDEGAVVLRQAFARRAAEKRKGKRKELSPQDAAMMIQVSFRAYLIRRSQALRALRELAVAKAKLKEIRALFNNFTYRRRVSRDAEERQKFSERIIVLLLTVDAIEGADLMVRAAKRSMVDELEAMLDVVDPQPQGRSLSMRRTFDMPDGVIQKEIAAGVAQVVRMLDEGEDGSL